MWNALLEAGAEFGIRPCGLGARNTLRMEAGMSLYGHEISDEINVLEAGLDRWLKLDKGALLGARAAGRAGCGWPEAQDLLPSRWWTAVSGATGTRCSIWMEARLASLRPLTRAVFKDQHRNGCEGGSGSQRRRRAGASPR